MTTQSPARRLIVRYAVGPEHVEQNEQLVRAVYAELHARTPAGLRYRTFRVGDGGEFLHLAFTETADGQSPLLELPAFRAFQTGLGERCTQPPVLSELHELGSFGWGDRAG